MNMNATKKGAVNLKEYFGLNEENPFKIKSVNDMYIKIPNGYDAQYLVNRQFDWNILNDHVTFKQANDSKNYKTEHYPKIRDFAETLIYEIFGGDNQVLNLNEDRIEIDNLTMRVTYEEYNISGLSFHCRIASDEDVYLSDLVLPFGWYEMLMMKQQRNGGIWIFGGDMGSGKSTSIYAYICEYLKKFAGEALTYEEPVEKNLPEEIGNARIFQNNIPLGVDWDHVARRIRRFQPASTGNIIFIGEINNYQTARIAISSAVLGTNVISTAHGASIKDILLNLRDCLNNTANSDKQITNNAIAQTLRFMSHQEIVDNEHSTGGNWDSKKVSGDFLFNPFVDGGSSISQMLRDQDLKSLSTELDKQRNRMQAAQKLCSFNEKMTNTPVSMLNEAQYKLRHDAVHKELIEPAIRGGMSQ